MCPTNSSQKFLLAEDEIEKRVAEAVALFKSGYNCSQSVVAAYAGLYGLSRELSLRISASFGGGIGRMRQTCGTACGMFLLAGLDCGATDASDRKGKNGNYAVVQELAGKFEKKNGSLICAELLGLAKKGAKADENGHKSKMPEKRPCEKMVETGARLFGEYLLRRQQEK